MFNEIWSLQHQTTYLENYSGDLATLYHRPSRRELVINASSIQLLKLLMHGYTINRIADKIKSGDRDGVISRLQGFVTQLQNLDMLTVGDPQTYPFKLRKKRRDELQLENIQVEILKGCNLRCTHCYMSAPTFTQAKDFQEMEFETFEKIAIEAHEMGTETITITGGEPLIHKRLRDMIQLVHDMGMKAELLTNATRIDEDWADWFQQQYIHKLYISVDGLTETTHDTFRGVPGSHKRTIKAIKMLKQRNIPMRINVTSHRENIDEIPGLLKYINEELGVPFAMDIVEPNGLGELSQELLIKPEEYAALIEPYRSKKSDEAYYPLKDIPVEKRSYFCGAGNSYVFINSGGGVQACCSMSGSEYHGGSIHEKSIDDIWMNSENLNNVRYMSCRNINTCPVASECLGGCRSRALHTFGALDAPDYFSCAIYGIEVPEDIQALIRQHNQSKGLISLDSIK